MSDIENIFREKLTNHEVGVSEGLWLSVADGLEKKKKRRVFILILSAAIAGILLLLGLFYIVNNHKSELKTENNQVASIITKAKEKASNIKENSQHEEINNQEDVEDSRVNSLKKNDLNNLSEHATKTNSTKSINSSKTRTLDNNKTTDSIVGLNTKNTVFKTLHSSRRDVSPTINNEISQKDITINATPIKDLVKTDKKENTTRNREGICNVLDGKYGIKMSNISTDDIFSRMPIALNSAQLNTCSAINTNHFFVGLHFSPDFYSKNLYGEDEEYQLLRSNSEKTRFSMTVGLDIGYTFKNGALLKTGFSYSEINEKFHHREIQKIQTIITIDTIIDNGSMIIIKDTTRKIIYGNSIEKPISFKLYDIPLIFGLQYGLTNNQKLGMNIGIIFNVVSTNSGYIFDKDQKIVKFNSEFPDQNIFKTNVGISIYSSFTYSYAVNKNINIFVEPKARFHINSFTKSGYSLGQKYNTFSVGFGTVYHFPKAGG